MASIGHGISEAVRNHISIWIDDSLVDILYQEYQKSGGVLSKDGSSGFKNRIRKSESWVRKSRKTTPSGYERLYQCKTVQKAALIVHSPEEDLSANGYVFQIDGRSVAGGKTKLKSAHVSSILSRKDKTSTRQQDIMFVKLSEEQLRRMDTEMRFGDGLHWLENERCE